MIVLNLLCGAGHRFEGWFASSAAFEAQAAEGRINCPHCNRSDIKKLPSGPNITKNAKELSSDSAQVLDKKQMESLLSKLQELGDASEDVGQRFPEEVRKIHYNEAPSRNIKGQASLAEARDLLEEGIPVLPIPGKATRH